MGNETDGADSIEELFQSGKIDENSSIADIEAALLGDVQEKGDEQPDLSGTSEAETGDAGEGKETEPGEAAESEATGKTQSGDQPDAKETGSESKGAGAESSSRDQQATESERPIAGPNGTTIPYGVLKGTRKELDLTQKKLKESEERERQERERAERLERELNELRAQQQQAAQQTREVQAAATAAGVKGDVRTIDVEKLRDNFPAEIVDAIEALQATNAALAEQVQALKASETRRVETEEETFQRLLQEDIDSVPQLAEWQANDKLKWKAAVAIDDELARDPEWKDRPRVERFKEVVRQLGGNLNLGQHQQQSTTTAAGTKEKVDQALAKASQRAVPLSHSGLPTGFAPAQSVTQSYEQMDVTEIADKFAAMTDEQIEAELLRVSRGV